jgi:hypothetical protein
VEHYCLTNKTEVKWRCKRELDGLREGGKA